MLNDTLVFASLATTKCIKVITLLCTVRLFDVVLLMAVQFVNFRLLFVKDEGKYV